MKPWHATVGHLAYPEWNNTVSQSRLRAAQRHGHSCRRCRSPDPLLTADQQKTTITSILGSQPITSFFIAPYFNET